MGNPSVPTPPKFDPATFTALNAASLQSLDPSQANALADQYDKQSYALSDADFANRHPDLLAANKINESDVLNAVKGNVPIAVQSQLVNAGLGEEAQGFAGAIPGSIGAAGVARNLGIGYGQYMQGIEGELGQLNQQDQERSFGIGGQGAVNLQEANDQQYNAVIAGNQAGMNQTAIANATGQNASNQGGFAGALQAYSDSLANSRALTAAGVQAGSQLGVAAAQNSKQIGQGFASVISALGNTSTGG